VGKAMGGTAIVGVVRDVHSHSFRAAIAPTILRVDPRWVRNVLIRIGDTDVRAALELIEHTWKAVGRPDQYHMAFVDQTLDGLYRDEMRFEAMIRSFAWLAMLLSCLGLFGISLFIARQRTKEIGIRKVLGASIGGICALLSRDYLIVAILATVVACPVVVLLIQGWLEHFVYRAGVSPWLYLLTAAAAIGVVGIAVSYHAIRAATSNPVRALRYE
jgi:putative ABC transport system permease protein